MLDQAAGVPPGLGQAPGAPLQGGDRVGPAHAGHGRLPAPRPARLPGAGHGPRRRARPVLGREGLRHPGGVPPLLRPHRAAGPARQAGLHDRRDARGRPRGRALRARPAGRRPWPTGASWARTAQAVAGGRLPARTCRSATAPPWAASACPSPTSTPPPAIAWSSASRARAFENDWDVWVYPPRVSTRRAGGVTLAQRSRRGAPLAAWRPGAECFLQVPPDRVRGRREPARSRSASRASSGTPPGPAARRRTPSASSAIRSTRRSPPSRPSSTATGSGGTW